MAALAAPIDARAQLPDSVSAATELSLITVFPGDAIYSAFGHSTFRFHDPGRWDIVFNFGTFDDTDPWFVPRFTYGKLEYALSYTSMTRQLESARFEGRTVVEQKLDVSAVSVQALYVALLENSRPENRFYRYDFLFDNCATILRDLLFSLEGDAVRFDSTGTPQESFRELLQPYLNQRAGYDFGIALALGSTVDRTARYDERSFLPIELMNAVAGATIASTEADSSVNPRPLVASADTLYSSGNTATSTDRSMLLVWVFSILGLLWVGASRIVTPPALLDRLLFGILGMAGLVLCFIWFISEHTVGAANWNLLLMLPTHLFPALMWNRGRGGIWRAYWVLTATLGGALLLLQPVLAQSLHPALYPILFTVLWRCFTYLRLPSGSPDPVGR